MANILRVEFDSKDEWNIKDVTVYEDRAQVVRVLHYKASDAGEVDLQLQLLPTTVLLNSVRAEVLTGEGSVVEVSAEKVTGEVKSIVQSERKTEIYELLETLNVELNVLREKKNFLTTFFDNLVPSSEPKETSETNEIFETLSSVKNLENFAKALEDYTLDMNTIRTRESDIEKKKTKLLNEKDEISLKEFTEAEKDAKDTSMISVLLNVKEKAVNNSEVIVVKLTYVVENCNWEASYDIRVVKAENSVELSYFGKITNNSEENWKDVQLSLSTARPSRGGDLKELKRGILKFVPKFKPKPRAQTHQRQVQVDQVQDLRDDIDDIMLDNAEIQDLLGDLNDMEDFDDEELDAELEALGDELNDELVLEEPEYMKKKNQMNPKEHKGGSATFKLSRLCSIESDNRPHKQSIAIIPFTPQFTYVVSPRVEVACYLKCSSRNDSKYVLVPGPMSVFFNGSFVTTSFMTFVNKREEFELFLGRVEKVKVHAEPEVVKNIEKKKGLLSSKQSLESRTRVLKISNTLTEDIDLLIYEQLPLAKNNKIKVQIHQPKLGKRGIINSYNNLEYSRKLKRGKELTFTFRYSVQWPNSSSLTYTESNEGNA